MGHVNKPMRRADTRSEVATLTLRGLVQSPGQERSPCMIWDISDNGLRLWSPDKLAHGTRVIITIAKPFILTLTAEVRWCRAFDSTEGYYAGVRVLEHKSRLESLHQELCAKMDERFKERFEDNAENPVAPVTPFNLPSLRD